ncbi:MAG: HupE/UreJ family protein [Pricia sp.]|nr:HupE/UreJ family protein [Pricia sp.]
MESDFWFYTKLGLSHVLDFAAYDHMLFLCALVIPFTLKMWKQAVLLASLFAIAHCVSLALAAFDIIRMDSDLIEFLIPVTIFLTAVFNSLTANSLTFSLGLYLQALTATFFGLIHGFGFSNYFNMILAQESEKLEPLIGFAIGIELAQLIIILFVLMFSHFFVSVFAKAKDNYVFIASAIIALVTIPMLIRTFPL